MITLLKHNILCFCAQLKNFFVITAKAIEEKKFKEAAASIDAITTKLSTLLHSVSYLLLVIGVGLLILSFKNDDANSKEKGIMALCVAAILWGIDSILL